MFGAVYKIKCSDCQATYIGGTSGNLSTRLKEHKRGTNKGDLNNNIAKYHLKTNHTIDCDSATCLNYSTDYYQRIALESWFITLEQKLTQSLSTISRTLQMFIQQETVTNCLLFLLQPIYLHNLRTRLHSQSHHAFTIGYSIY